MRTPHRTVPPLGRPRRRLSRAQLAALGTATVAALAASLAPTAASASGSSAPAVSPTGRADRAVSTGATTDAADTYGRLDIQRVRDRVVALDQTHYLVGYRVRTYTAFDSARLDGDERNFDLELDRDGASGSERTVMVVDDDGLLEAQIISTATRQVLATVPVSRPNDHAIDLVGPRRLLGARSYFWASDFHAERSPRCGDEDGVAITCQDSVPDTGWIRLDRPAWPEEKSDLDRGSAD
jgi:hypothetical protein